MSYNWRLRQRKRINNKQNSSWLTPSQIALSAIAITVSIMALVRTHTAEILRRQTTSHELLSEATDLIYFSQKTPAPEWTVSERDMSMAAWRISAALEIDRADIDALVLASRWNYLNLDYKASVRFAERALRKNPNLADVRLLLAEALYALKSFEEALPHLREAIRLDAAQVRSRSLLGYCLHELRSWDQSTAAFEEAVTAEPQTAQYRYELAYAYYYQGRLEKARLQLCEALKIDPEHDDSHELLSKIMYWQGRIANTAEYKREMPCPELRRPAAPILRNPGTVFQAVTDPNTGAQSLARLWKVPATDEWKPFGQWYE